MLVSHNRWKGELIEIAKEREEIIKEAVEEVEELLADEEIRALYEYRLSAMIEENSRIGYAKEEALKSGMEQRT